MSRNYPNFLDAYLELHKDQFVPDKFHFWTAVSVIAGALERKVWLPWNKQFSYYPNLYILLVSHPGIGKSSAIMPGVKLLRHMARKNGEQIKFIPSQVTEARLIEIMRHHHTFNYHNTKHEDHCSGYYHASEASACLRDLYGSFINTITSFYDCDEEWEKATMSMGDETFKIKNVCFNILAGCTFDYLGKLITDDNIMGGFASRCTYVIQKAAVKRSSPWQDRGLAKTDESAHMKLLSDLAEIHRLTGPVSADQSFQEKWEKWFPAFDAERQALKSEKLQSLMVRKSTTMLKLCMILSAAEGNDLVLKGHHWERAMELTDEVEEDLPDMLRETKSKDTGSQAGLNNAIFAELLMAPSQIMRKSDLELNLTVRGFNPSEIKKTIDMFVTDNREIKVHMENGVRIELIGNPDNNI